MRPVTALFATVLAVPTSALRIMFMGDSITEITCWRTMLQDDLDAAGLITDDIEFVGSMTNNAQNCQGTSNWDLHHEGHSGYKAVDIANNYLQGWLANTQPDIINFMLGTNDVTAGTSTDQIMSAYTRMVQLMRDANPSVHIIVDKVIPLSWSQSSIDAINNRIDAWAASQTTSRSPIYVVDTATGFSTSWLRDGVHPSLQGDEFIADKLFPVFAELLMSGGSDAGTATTTPPAATTTLANPGTNCASRWGQCGGVGWTGATCCVSGSSCQYMNDYYSQCL